MVRETFKESLEKHYAKLKESHDKDQKSRRYHSDQEEKEWDDFEPSIPQRVNTAMSLFSTDGDNETRIDEEMKPQGTGTELFNDIVEHYDNIAIRREYDTIFGRLQIIVNAVFASSTIEDLVEHTTSMRTYKATLSFRPSSWLSRPALWRITTQRTTSSTKNNLHIVPTFSPVISHQSPIFKACQQGHVVEVQNMLVTRQASIHDIDEWGRGLMHVCSILSRPQTRLTV